MTDREAKERQLNEALSVYYHKVRSLFAFRRWRDSELDDLTQEVFFRLWLAIDEGKDIQDVQSFIGGIAFNVSREQVRKKIRGREIEAATSLTPTDGHEDRTSEESEQHRLIRRLIVKLDEEDQEIILATFYWGLNSSQLGEMLNIPRQTALSRLQRAMRRIQAMPESRGLRS